MNPHTTPNGYRLELLQNGYVRVDTPSGLVAMVDQRGERGSVKLPYSVREAGAEAGSAVNPHGSAERPEMGLSGASQGPAEEGARGDGAIGTSEATVSPLRSREQAHVREGLTTYVVRWDFGRYAPARWQGTRGCALFGDRNAGVTVTAATAEEARTTYAAANRLNPFYLEATPA
jgi:hypothetical protein